MTHDELLEELDEIIKDFDQKYDNSNPYYKALRAVVELHQVTADGNCAWCYLCNYERTELYMDSAMYAYPCPTIQAIEKELG